MPVAFKKIDNFEGMILLSHVDNKIQLLLVSDNNFNSNQNTEFLVLDLDL